MVHGLILKGHSLLPFWLTLFSSKHINDALHVTAILSAPALISLLLFIYYLFIVCLPTQEMEHHLWHTPLNPSTWNLPGQINNYRINEKEIHI